MDDRVLFGQSRQLFLKDGKIFGPFSSEFELNR